MHPPTRRSRLAFEVCKLGSSWTAVVVCDICGEDIESGGRLHWSWEDEEDDKRYSFALPVVTHEKCSKAGSLLSRPGGSEMVRMDLMEYVSLLLLKYPLSPGMSHGHSIHKNES